MVPTHSVVEALAALLGYDPDAELAVEHHARSPSRSRGSTAGEVTQSVRDTVAECGPIRKGDWIAIGPEGICVATDSAAEAAFALVDALVDEDSEIVTVLVGADARAAETQRVREHLAFAHPTWSSRCTTAASRSTRT